MIKRYQISWQDDRIVDAMPTQDAWIEIRTIVIRDNEPTIKFIRLSRDEVREVKRIADL